MKQTEIIKYCDNLLEIEKFSDYCPNGLQIEGDNRQTVKIAIGVSISLEFIEKAIEQDADLIITHHGLIWNRDERIIRGPLKRKMILLLNHGIAAAAYHLPLDFHPQLGNNAQLADKIGLVDLEPFSQTPQYAQGVMGTTTLRTIDAVSEHVAEVLNRQPLTLPYGPDKINKIAIVTGGAQGFFLEAIEAGADCFITGEISEQNFAMSREHGVHFISAGHYCTEKFGIQALGAHLGEQFDLQIDFIDIPNPI
ncbi:Nif3-like dinuclear metal center hexameric protein [bacterium]|nr:Nif3-like dinuclear metal center hexameric protein [bacterium]